MSEEIHVNVDEARERLAELIDAAVRSETVLIEKSHGQGTVIVQLVIVPQQPRGRPKFGSAKGLIVSMSDDFDAPLDDFREYM